MSTTSIPYRWTYNAFVSFRGDDIRKSFIDHLFKDFKQKGIHAFRDDSQLPRGEDISSQLYKAIEESRFLIVIFSKNYASSSWCLKELVKILECKQKGEHKHVVQIVFFDVKPDVVRKQIGAYSEAFAEHELSNKLEVAKWKEALCMASKLSGWDLQDMANGYESKLIDSISKIILEKVCDGPFHVGENLVGVEDHLNKMNLPRFIGLDKVNTIGICGVGGIGKTTFAKAIFDLLHIHFEECIFLDDVQGATKQHGLLHVIRQLISGIMKTTDVNIYNISQGIVLMKQIMASRRILLVLDGVDQHEHLEALAGSCSWFSPGSLIIFTSKDRQLLAHMVDHIHDMEFLDDDKALELFCLYAFRQKHPIGDFKELAHQVLKYVQGHPLALRVLGCFLYGQSMDVWKSELDKLQTHPIADIQKVLRLSFDGLDITQQRVFLDIASYLVGEEKDFAESVLDSCNFFPSTNIKALVDRSLVTISMDKSLHMHNLIQSMAKEIVREESMQSGERSRLWIQSEVCEVLKRNQVTKAIEVLVLSMEKSSQNIHVDCESFKTMNNLRILIMHCLDLENSDCTSELNLSKRSMVKFTGRLEFLSNELRLLFWLGCPFKVLPSKFYPENIVSIDMSYSHIENLWTTTKCLKKLKTLTLAHCCYLKSTPDFTEIPNLENLILEGCINLVEVHPSIGMLKKLVVLIMRNCRSLRSFPSKVEMDSLEALSISGCSKVKKWPTTLGTIKTLKDLDIDVVTTNELPSFLFSLRNLQTLSIFQQLAKQPRWTSTFYPSKLQSFVLPSFASLRFLTYLNAGRCNISTVNPNSFNGSSCLETLNLSGNNFTSLPSLGHLSSLRFLYISNCKKLEVLPELPPNVVKLSAFGCTSLHKLVRIPNSQDDFRCSHFHLQLMGCQMLVEKHTTEELMSMLLPQGWHRLHRSYDMFLPGNRIPSWFKHQSMGNYVVV